MEKEKSAVSQQILNLILEILYLLTGEDYIIVKKPGRQTAHKNRLQVVEGICRTLGNVLRTPAHSVPPREDNRQKILQLTSKITELLTREVPMRCQDVAVFFSMEEWEYLQGHKELYNDVMMEDHQNTELLDGSMCRSSLFSNVTADLVNEDGLPMDTESGTERLNVLYPRDMQMTSNGMITEKTSGYQNGNLSAADPNCDSSIHIKVEPYDALWDGANVPITTTRSPAQLHSLHIKAELTSHEGENAPEPGRYSQHPPSPVMEEPISCRRQNLTPPNFHTSTNPTHYASTRNIEEPISCDGGNLTKSNVQTQQHPSAPILEEPAASNKEDLNDRNLPIHIKEGLVSCEDHEDTQTRRYPTRQSTAALVKPRGAAPRNRRKRKNLKSPSKEPSVESATSGDPKTEGNNEESSNSSIYSVRQSADAMEILYHCPSCHKGFFSNLDLARHQVIHTVDKLFVCSSCGKSFTELSFLVKHQVIHTDLKLCVCPVCGGCFYSETSLAKHQKSHSLPLYCSTCGRCFFNKTELEIHKRKHTGERPYACCTCGKHFFAKSVLTKHMLTHKQAEQSEPLLGPEGSPSGEN
ncbi:oocyte zinc finger protein XlCOF7.1-like [Eleutherodactylus coqui]|uniref:oocyte zinc finger protein XlCOF7.1-like n=1 Tax=Eleutherodactylus coqui TaxID=57060 RepID=UPI003462C183